MGPLQGNFVGDALTPYLDNLCQALSGQATSAKKEEPAHYPSECSDGQESLENDVAVRMSTHFRSAVQVEVMEQLKRLGLPQLQPGANTIEAFLKDIDCSELPGHQPTLTHRQ